VFGFVGVGVGVEETTILLQCLSDFSAGPPARSS